MPELKQFVESLCSDGVPVSCVLDGAQFDHLPNQLADRDLPSRALYLDRGDNHPQRVITAPQVVLLTDETEDTGPHAVAARIDALFALTGGGPGAVFWVCPDGTGPLYRHLRGLNMVCIPRPDAAPDAIAARSDLAFDTVLFRHADANVMAQTLPALDPAEMARVFGPATEILAAPDPDWIDGADLLHMARPDDLPDAPPGLLHLGAPTMARMAELRTLRANRITRGYLRRHLPPAYQGWSDETLDDVVVSSRASGQELGIRSKGGHQRWAYLVAVTEGKVVDQPDVRAFIQNGDRSPDAQVREAMRETLATLRAAASEAGA